MQPVAATTRLLIHWTEPLKTSRRRHRANPPRFWYSEHTTSMANPDTSRPLLGASKTALPPSLPRLSKVASTALLALGAIRAIGGVACLVSPQLAARAFLVDLPAHAGVVAQVAGSRELVLGALTLEARRRAGAAAPGGLGGADGDRGARDMLRKVVLANIVADSLDVLVCLVGEVTGTISVATAGTLGGAAAVFVGLGVLTLRRV